MVRSLNETEFSTVVRQSPGQAVVRYWATWCGHCPPMGRVIEEVAGDYPDVTFAAVDVDSQPALATGIRALPTVVFYSNGQEVNRLVGVHSATAVRRVLDSLP
jgi:thioredoxin 1